MDFGGRAANGAQQGAAPDVMSWWVDAVLVRLCSQGFPKFISIGFSHIWIVFFCRMLSFGDTQVHGNPGGFTRVPDRGIPYNSGMRCGYHQPVLFIFQLGFSILTRPNMEADNKVSLLIMYYD